MGHIIASPIREGTGTAAAWVVARVARRVGVAEGVVQYVGVPVELLRVGWIGDKRVGAYEPADTRTLI